MIGRRVAVLFAGLGLGAACSPASKGQGGAGKAAGGAGSGDGDAAEEHGAGDSGAIEPGDSGSPDDTAAPPVVYDPWPFADGVLSYEPGPGAGFGQDRFPEIVFGPPEAPGDGGGSLDVLSLGNGGSIVLELRDLDLVDAEGPDLLVFENPFVGWYEAGVVGVSLDGLSWVEWPCDPTDSAGMFPGCAGVGIVYSNGSNGVDATDPAVAGGDAFDLAAIGVDRARFVRIRDAGTNTYDGLSGGFDLDAIAAVHAEPR